MRPLDRDTTSIFPSAFFLPRPRPSRCGIHPTTLGCKPCTFAFGKSNQHIAETSIARRISGKVSRPATMPTSRPKPAVGEESLHMAGEGSHGPSSILQIGWFRRNDNIVPVGKESQQLEERQLSTIRLAIQQHQPEAEVLPGYSPLPQPAPQPRMYTIAEDSACRATDQSTCWVSGVN